MVEAGTVGVVGMTVAAVEEAVTRAKWRLVLETGIAHRESWIVFFPFKIARKIDVKFLLLCRHVVVQGSTDFKKVTVFLQCCTSYS